ncbi:PTS transporter subunit EIIC [Shigella flexneri]
MKLPDFLSFFGGKRFVPIATDFFCLVLAAILGYVWPPVQHAIHAGGEWIVSAGALGSGIFGFINHLLIPTGLHQVLNTIAGSRLVNSPTRRVRFSTVISTASMPVTAPRGCSCPASSDYDVRSAGAALAMYFAAPKERRPMVGGMLLSVAVTAFLTGVTEPLEFLFMFLAPLLYLLHALLTGISLLWQHCWVSMLASLSLRGLSTTR